MPPAQINAGRYKSKSRANSFKFFPRKAKVVSIPKGGGRIWK
jgi:hypothetical protein